MTVRSVDQGSQSVGIFMFERDIKGMFVPSTVKDRFLISHLRATLDTFALSTKLKQNVVMGQSFKGPPFKEEGLLRRKQKQETTPESLHCN